MYLLELPRRQGCHCPQVWCTAAEPAGGRPPSAGLTGKGGPVRMRAFDWKPGPRRQGHRTPRPRLVGTKGRLGVSRVTSWALAAATALFALGTAPAWATAAPLSPGAYRVAVAPAVHHDVSAPLR